MALGTLRHGFDDRCRPDPGQARLGAGGAIDPLGVSTARAATGRARHEERPQTAKLGGGIV